MGGGGKAATRAKQKERHKHRAGGKRRPSKQSSPEEDDDDDDAGPSMVGLAQLLPYLEPVGRPKSIRESYIGGTISGWSPSAESLVVSVTIGEVSQPPVKQLQIKFVGSWTHRIDVECSKVTAIVVEVGDGSIHYSENDEQLEVTFHDGARGKWRVRVDDERYEAIPFQYRVDNTVRIPVRATSVVETVLPHNDNHISKFYDSSKKYIALNKVPERNGHEVNLFVVITKLDSPAQSKHGKGYFVTMDLQDPSISDTRRLRVFTDSPDLLPPQDSQLLLLQGAKVAWSQNGIVEFKSHQSSTSWMAFGPLTGWVCTTKFSNLSTAELKFAQALLTWDKAEGRGCDWTQQKLDSVCQIITSRSPVGASTISKKKISNSSFCIRDFDGCVDLYDLIVEVVDFFYNDAEVEQSRLLVTDYTSHPKLPQHQSNSHMQLQNSSHLLLCIYTKAESAEQLKSLSGENEPQDMTTSLRGKYLHLRKVKLQFTAGTGLLIGNMWPDNSTDRIRKLRENDPLLDTLHHSKTLCQIQLQQVAERAVATSQIIEPCLTIEDIKRQQPHQETNTTCALRARIRDYEPRLACDWIGAKCKRCLTEVQREKLTCSNCKSSNFLYWIYGHFLLEDSTTTVDDVKSNQLLHCSIMQPDAATFFGYNSDRLPFVYKDPEILQLKLEALVSPDLINFKGGIGHQNSISSGPLLHLGIQSYVPVCSDVDIAYRIVKSQIVMDCQ